MTKRIRFDHEAAEELEMAAQWYDARRTNLGLDFLAIVRDALERIEDRPQTWPLARDVPVELNVRRFVIRRFPYSIIFVELDAEIRVLAIAHTSREPGFWRGRL